MVAFLPGPMTGLWCHEWTEKQSPDRSFSGSNRMVSEGGGDIWTIRKFFRIWIDIALLLLTC